MLSGCPSPIPKTLFRPHRIKTRYNQGAPSMPATDRGHRQSCPRSSLPTRDVPALLIIEKPDGGTRTLPSALQNFPSPTAPWLGWLVAQQNAPHRVSRLI